MLVPLLPEGVSLGTARLVFAVGFFVVAFALTLRPGVITRVLGRITGPALIALIVLVVGAAVISPLGPAAAPHDTGAAVQGLLTGYQTMDLLASLAFGIIIAETIHELGVTDDKRVAFEISRSGVMPAFSWPSSTAAWALPVCSSARLCPMSPTAPPSLPVRPLCTLVLSARSWSLRFISSPA